MRVRPVPLLHASVVDADTLTALVGAREDPSGELAERLRVGATEGLAIRLRLLVGGAGVFDGWFEVVQLSTFLNNRPAEVTVRRCNPLQWGPAK